MRSLSDLLARLSDFDDFRNCLAKDFLPQLGYSGIVDFETGCDGPLEGRDADIFEMDSLLIPLKSTDAGYVRLKGKSDGEMFDAGDLMWLGALSNFISVVITQAKKHKAAQENTSLLKYLIDKLPLGVVCLNVDGVPIIQSELSKQLLGEAGLNRLSDLVKEGQGFAGRSAQLHMEIKGKLLYSEGRRVKIDEGLEIITFVLYDLSEARDRLLIDLEREAYRVESRGGQLTMALLEMKNEPGRIYRQLQSASEDLQIDPSKIQPLDAYSCVCLLPGESPRKVRSRLRSIFSGTAEGLRLSLVHHRMSIDSESIAEYLIGQAERGLQPGITALLPKLLVLDVYPAVAESLEIISADLCQIEQQSNLPRDFSGITRGVYDGVYMDLDNLAPSEREEFKAAVDGVGDGVKVFYTTHKQPSMVRELYALSGGEVIFQKPFHADVIRDTLLRNFDLA